MFSATDQTIYYSLQGKYRACYNTNVIVTKRQVDITRSIVRTTMQSGKRKLLLFLCVLNTLLL